MLDVLLLEDFVPLSFSGIERDVFPVFDKIQDKVKELKIFFFSIYSGFSYNLTFFNRAPPFAWGCLKTVSLDFSISLA